MYFRCRNIGRRVVVENIMLMFPPYSLLLCCVLFQSAERLAGAQPHRKIPNLKFTIEIHMQATQQANRDTNMHL